MSNKLTRRQFLNKSLTTTMAAASTGTLSAANIKSSADNLPLRKIGNVTVSRLIIGGNPISGNAHSRDLPYVSSLMRRYFTDEKCVETLHICQQCGINTLQFRTDSHIVRILDKYWKQGGKMQWIAQIKPRKPDISDIMNDIRMAFDNGAVGGYLQGQVADRLVQEGRIDLVQKAFENIKANGKIAGVGGHLLDVIIACERAGIKPDFYMKTLHRGDYWSAGIKPKNDNIWSITPEKTIEFMKNVHRPWIAFKVLAAGAIHPREGFEFAFENGANFICVGMFDFQVRENVIIAKDTLNKMGRYPSIAHAE
ncbi:MAG TPA: hypothetical protein DIU00_09275 [Phycisphaerales bacterium]|nr:hypothetical protein [Phycisphaerales bacterium]